jgi:hypothetical protein
LRTIIALESPNEYRYTSTAGVLGDRWVNRIQPSPVLAVAALAVAGLAEAVLAVATAVPPRHRAESNEAASRLIVLRVLVVVFIISLPAPEVLGRHIRY